MADGDDLPEIFDWPWFGLVEDVRPTARARLSAGAPIALATLVDARGSSPRPVGARMLIDARGIPEGFVSGGCVEASVVSFARSVLSDGKPLLITLGAGSPYVDIRLPCGGSIDLLIEKVTPNDPIVEPWLTAMAVRESGFWLADLDAGARAFVAEPGNAPPALARAAALAGASAAPAARQANAFFRREEPQTRLIVVGADPVALALLRLAQTMGLEVHLVRESGPDQGPDGVSYRTEAPTSALTALGVDPFTAVITTTHDLERDANVIVAALKSGALYVGALGSKRRVPERRRALTAAGLSAAQIARVRSPIGVDIGAAAPFEIALAAIADVIAVRRRPNR